jgi:hypothetical protein
VSNCNYNTPVLHTDCGFILDSVATITQQDYLGVALDPLVAAPVVQFIPSVGGTITNSNTSPAAPAPGLIVTASRAGVTLGTDTTDSEGGYFIGDLTPGPVTLTVATAGGTVLTTDSAITVLADSSTNFIDLGVPVPASAPVAVTVGVSPAGLSFTVDGVAYVSTQTFNWIPTSTHTISTAAVQAAAVGTQYVFASWSNGAAASQTITVPATPVTYTAKFTTQYLLTTNVSPANSGALTPLTGYVNAGTVVTLTATPASGYKLASFSGGLTGTPSPATVTMNAPVSVTANFAAIAPILTASISARSGAASSRQWTITLANSGSGIGVNTSITNLSIVPVGSPGCTSAPAILQPAAGPSVSAPLAVGTIGPLGSASASVIINFSGCQTNTRFTVTIGYTANSGAYNSSATFNNQFQ